MSCGSIYKIVFPNGKHYIGITTVSLKHRRYQHKHCALNDDTQCLYNAIRKYDMIDTFELVEIDTADTIEELYEKEIRNIIDYNSYFTDGFGYNMTRGGDGNHGYIYTENDKQKMSESAKEYFRTPGARQRQSEIISAVHKDNPNLAKEHSEKMKKLHNDNPNLAKKHSERMKQMFDTNPNLAKEHGERMKKYHKDNPDRIKEKTERMKMYYEDNPEAKLLRIKQSLDTKKQNNPFDMFTTDGLFIKTFTYQYEAHEYLRTEHNITSTVKICAVLRGQRASSAGFVFKYK